MSLTVSLPDPHSCMIDFPGNSLSGTMFRTLSLTRERGKWLLEIEWNGKAPSEGAATILGSGVVFTNRGMFAHRWEWDPADNGWKQVS